MVHNRLKEFHLYVNFHRLFLLIEIFQSVILKKKSKQIAIHHFFATNQSFSFNTRHNIGGVSWRVIFFLTFLI